MGIYKDNIVTSLLSQNLPILKGDSLNSVEITDNIDGDNSDIIYFDYSLPSVQQYRLGLSGALTSRSTLTFPVLRWGSCSAVTKDRLYVFGGYWSGYGNNNTIYYAPINADGTLGTWVLDTHTLPESSANATCQIIRNRVYIFGGNSSSSSSQTNKVYSAPIDDQGIIGEWIIEPVSLPSAVRYACSIVIGNMVHIYAGTALTSIFSAEIKEDGTLGIWSTSTLGINYAYCFSALIGNYIYTFGGYNSVGTNKIYKAPIAIDYSIGQFVEIGTLPITVDSHNGCFVSGNRVYLIGGTNSSSIYSAPIDSEGGVGTFVLESVTLSANTTYGTVAATKDHIYVIGNYSGSNVIQVLYIPGVGKNNYMDDIFDFSIILNNEISFISYALSKDGLTYQIYTGSIWKPIATSDPSVHGFTGEAVPYYWDSDTLEWVYSKSGMQEAISNALKYEDNRMTKTVLNSLSNFSSVFDTDTGEIYLAVSMFSYGKEKLEVSNIKLNNKGYWISEQYDLEDYVAIVTAATVKIGYSIPVGVVGYSDALKIYCMRSDQETWVECVNGVVSNLPNGLSTAGISVRFRVVWDSSVWVNIESVSIDFTLK